MKFRIFLIIFFLLRNLKGDHTNCNLNILRVFKLNGLEKPDFNSDSVLCGKRMDTCCSVLDELSILKLWKEHSLTHIKHQTKEIMNLYQSILALHPLFYNLSSELVPIHNIQERMVPYHAAYCTKIFFDDNEDHDIDRLNPKSQTERELYDHGFFKDNEYKENFDKVNKELMKFQDRMNQNFNEVIESDKNPERKLLETKNTSKAKIELSNGENNALEAANYIKSKFNQTIQNSIKKFHKLYKDSISKQRRKFLNVQKSFNKISNIIFITKKTPNFLRKLALNKDKEKSKTNGSILLDNIYGNHTTNEEIKNELENKKVELGDFLEKIKSFKKKQKGMEETILKERFKVPLRNKFMSKIIKKVISERFLSKSRNNYPLRIRQAPSFNPITKPMYFCNLKINIFFRRFYIANTHKYRYCDTVFTHIKKFKMD